MTFGGAEPGAALRRRSIDLVKPWMTELQVDQWHNQVATGLGKAVDATAVWEFLFGAFLVLRVAWDVKEDARIDTAELQELAKLERAPWRAVGLLGTVEIDQLGRRSSSPRPAARKRGRKNETALRDLVIDQVQRLCPDQASAEVRWTAAIGLAYSLWREPFDPVHLESLQRDMRRRRERAAQDSREFDYFFVQFERRLREALDL